jgi:hypothetical protein
MIILILLVDVFIRTFTKKKEVRMKRATYTPTFPIIHTAVTAVDEICA